MHELAYALPPKLRQQGVTCTDSEPVGAATADSSAGRAGGLGNRLKHAVDTTLVYPSTRKTLSTD